MSTPKNTPHLTVIRGEPTIEEIAVLTVVLTARAAAARTAAETAEQPVPVSGWRDRARGMRNRPPTRPGPGAWRSSTR